MKKKLLASLLCVAMAATLMIGCGSKEEKTNDSAKTEASDVHADPVEQRKVYVTPDWVQSVIDGNQEGYEDYVIAEVSYGSVKDCVSYNEGHIPGALYVDNCEVEDATGSEEGAYNLLAADEVVDNLLAHGITKDTKVILYGADAAGVGRQAYAYLWAGVEDVKILNGGIDAWKAAGYDVETKVNEAEACADSFGTTAPAHPEYWVSVEDAKDRLENDDNFKLVSIRSKEEWLGETTGYNYMDQAGEPEGAVWGKGADTAFDVAQFQNEDGTVKDLEGLKEVWADCDFDIEKNDLAFYCGTGWRAAIPFLVMYENGYDNMAVYDGGWYEWLMHKDYPVQIGDPASNDCRHVTVAKTPGGKAAKY